MADEELPRLATRLLPFVSDTELATMLLGLSQTAVPLTLRCPIDDTVAMQLTKQPWPKAATAAGAARNPEVLDRLARDSRAMVRRTVAANEATASDTLAYLHTWARKRQDAPTLNVLVDRLDVDALLEGFADDFDTTGVWLSDVQWHRFSNRVIDDGTRDDVLTVFARDMHVQLQSNVTKAVLDGKRSDVTLDEVLDAAPTSARPKIMLWAISHGPNLSLESARMFIDNLVELNGLGLANVLNTGRHLEAGVAEHLLDAHLGSCGSLRDRIWNFVSRCSSGPPELITRLLRHGERDTFSVTVRIRAAELDADQVAIAVRRLDQDPLFCDENGTQIAAVLFAETPLELTSEQRLVLLRKSFLPLTKSWLAGECQRPRPGEVAALIAEPGSAFAGNKAWAHRRGGQSQSEVPSTREQIAASMRDSFGLVLESDWADEFVDALDKAFLYTVKHDGQALRYVAAKFDAAFGSDPAAWHLAMSLFGDWEGSVAELITTVCDVCTIAPPPAFPDTEAEADVLAELDQLSLAL